MSSILKSLTPVELCVLSTVAGVTAHLGIFIRGEWHMHGAKIVNVHALLAVGLAVFEFRHNTSDQPLTRTSLAIMGYLLGLYGSIFVYRFFFHPLRHFPGPKLAKISKLWQAYQIRDSTNFRLLDRMHDEYGEFVRVGPAELAVFHPDAYQITEGNQTKCTKPDFNDIMAPLRCLPFERRRDVHEQRRKVWGAATNQKAIDRYQPRFCRQIDVLYSIIAQRSEAKVPVNVGEVMAWYAFDSMGEFAFNQDFGLMRNQEWHAVLANLAGALHLTGPTTGIVWAVRMCFSYIPWAPLIKDWFTMLRFCEDRVNDRINTKDQIQEADITGYFIDEAEKQGNTEEAMAWLRGDAVILVVAGSDTTYPTMTFLLYAIAKYPEHQQKIYEELQGVDPYDTAAIAKLEHLNAVLNESMRMFPAAATFVTRSTPPEGLRIGDTFIPGLIKMTAPRWTIHKLESAFPRGKEFIPERWTSQPELILNKEAFSPFGAGKTACVGKGIALTQMRMTVAKLLKDYSVSFVPGEDPDRVLVEMQDQITAKPGLLLLNFDKRE